MKLNLEAKIKEQELVKQYLEDTASQTLAEKKRYTTNNASRTKSLTCVASLQTFTKSLIIMFIILFN